MSPQLSTRVRKGDPIALPRTTTSSAARGTIKGFIDRLKLVPAVRVGWSPGVIEAKAYVDRFGASTWRDIVRVSCCLD
jgi:hypothetical protein